MGPWARSFLAALDCHPARGRVTELRVEPSLITAKVDGRRVTLSAPPIAPGIWAAIDGSVRTDRQSAELAQLLEHTWEEPLVPREVVRVGADDDVAAVAHAVAEAIEREPATLLRWRGYGGAASDHDPWRGSELPPLPPPARRPPESVPKRFGASGIATPDGDLVEVLVRAYRAFAVSVRSR
ncbi:MAG TPA: hypothetical protein VE982_07585 [Gaiellaceae bacterium]|nr:hypothetical protein [Gaiellaceae bacterium]